MIGKWILRFCLFYQMLVCCIEGFELKRVILSTNDNPNYIQFWPVVAPIWTAMGIRPTLALIADSNCPIDDSIGDVIRFDPLIDIPVSLQTQVIRLLLPICFPNEVCLISDIDMLPISRSYFVEGALSCPEEGFLVYRDAIIEYANIRYPMCYVAAKGRVFGSLFGISDKDQIPNIIRKWAAKGYGWNTDELLLFSHIKAWEEKGGLIVRLGHGVGSRLDRGCWIFDFKAIDVSAYIDCHCPRPYSEYKESIDQIVFGIHRHLQSTQ